MDEELLERIGNLTMPFGKYKGETITDLTVDQRGYLEWLADNADESALKICLDIWFEHN